jgi:hypothetical protein
VNKDQGNGIIERAIYSAVIFLVAKYGGKFGLTGDDGAWLAGGIVLFAGGTWAWIHNRPVSILNRAAEAIPAQSTLVIETPIGASAAERNEAQKLANAASDKVIAKA